MAEPRGRLSLAPWLWSSRLDLGLFLGSALLSLVVLAVGHTLGVDELPDWGWVLFVLGVDVAHVYATLFRTYFDRRELRARPLRYTLVPASVYGLGVLLCSHSVVTFWSVLAYTAVWHFVRQQVGWVRLYRARAQEQQLLDRWLDDGAIYAATLYPLLHWHAELDSRNFAWLQAGDFLAVSELATKVLPFGQLAWGGLLFGFFLRQAQRAWVERRLALGKVVLVSTTACIWYVGIVATNSDFAFTVTNVLVHGIPYLALLWAFARQRQKEAPELLGSRLVARGLGLFMALLIALAYLEELLWDRLVNHERPWLFGQDSALLSEGALTWVIPLLAVPQATHYILDGLLWRRQETRRLSAQRLALGFAPTGQTEPS